MAIIIEEQPKQKRAIKHDESMLQGQCYRWFQVSYPQYRGLLVSTFNELSGLVSPIQVAKFKQKGLTPGVSDMSFFLPRGVFHGLFIELKTPIGRQRDDQKRWQQAVEAAGYRYEIIRTFEDFQSLIKEYLSL